MKNNELVLLTNSFPYGNNETFIENEILFLSKKFDRIIIICQNITDNKVRKTPTNVHIERMNTSISAFKKISALSFLMRPIILKEFVFIKKSLKTNISKHKIKTMFSSLLKANTINKFIDNISTKYNLNPDRTILYSYWMDECALALSLNSNTKKLCRVHGWDLYFERHPENYLPFRKQILENIECFSISKKGKNYLEQKIGVKDIKTSYLGTPKLKREILNNQQKLIVSCSHLISLKRVSLIIDSIATCKTKNIKWIHFGEGELINKLEEKARKRNINFEFKGYVDNHKVLDFFQNNSIDLFINLSKTEGIPVSIMEAYSCGIPAIATNVGATAELVNIQNGIILSKNPTKEDVAKAIDEYLNSSVEKINQKRDIAFKTWETKFNAEINYKEFAEIISNL